MAAFNPIVGDNPKVLILGSMPGLISLDNNEYYAHPRNSFWWIMAALFKFELQLNYHYRCQQLIKNNIALWDVLYDCQRPGSMDSSIVKNSEVPNDFSSFFEENNTIESVIFNGLAAEKIFRRYNAGLMSDLLSMNRLPVFHRCPSTSPAHASITIEAKLKAWASVFK